MNTCKILIVEDDLPILNLMKITMESNDYHYLTATNGKMALALSASHNPDIMLLDLGLPDIDGIEVIEKIRSWSNMSIIVVSARTELTDKIQALDAGADDYISKPFSVEELLARIRAASRRNSMLSDRSSESSVFENGPLKIDYVAGCVYSNGEPVHLTPSEYKMLVVLSRNLGKVLTYHYITKEIWGMEWENHISSLRVITTTLRKKIGKEIAQQMIQTHVGIGYRMLKI